MEKNRLCAFTLLETVTVLLVTVLILGIPPILLKGFQARQEMDQAIKLTKAELSHASYYATLTNCEVNIINARESHLLIFYYAQKDRTTKIKKVQFSPRVTCWTTYDNFHINQEGKMSPTTFTFNCDGKTRQLKIQMQWGKQVLNEISS